MTSHLQMSTRKDPSTAEFYSRTTTVRQFTSSDEDSNHPSRRHGSGVAWSGTCASIIGRFVTTPSSRSVVKMSDEHEHKEITVETLSTPPLQIKPAPLPRRIGAGVIDSLVLGAVWLIFLIAFGRSLMPVPLFPDYSTLVPLALLSFVYYFVLEGLFGATIGKSLLKLIVLEKDSEVCSFSASFKRNLFRFVDWLPLLYLVGTIAVVISKDRQRIGDRLAGTIVTKASEKDPNPPPAPFLFH